MVSAQPASFATPRLEIFACFLWLGCFAMVFACAEFDLWPGEAAVAFGGGAHMTLRAPRSISLHP
jgi:hypothetical protein